MSILRIHNVRLGFATNSSSSHSVILLEEGRTLNPVPRNWMFGWDCFTLVDEHDKAEYLAAQLLTNLDYDAGAEEQQAVLTLVKHITGHKFELPGKDKDPLRVDHQSVWTFPYTDSGSFDEKFIAAVWEALKQENIAVLGGNDNDEGHPDTGMGEQQVFCDWLRNSESLRARYDEDANYWMLFDKETGAKFRVSFSGVNGSKADRPWYHELPDEGPKYASIPELVDLKVTDWCSLGCKFCYQGSTKEGKHASLDHVANILFGLANLKVPEVAIGGGEPTDWPHLDEAVAFCRELGIVPNITTRRLPWIREQILSGEYERFGGIAYSIDNAAGISNLASILDQLTTKHGQGFSSSNNPLVAQLVMGTVSREEFNKILDELEKTKNIRITLLGYKTTHRGSSYIPFNYDWWLEDVLARRRSFMVSIDTPMANQYQEQLENNTISRASYDTCDGMFSFYIDAVHMTGAASSYHHNDETEVSIQKLVDGGMEMPDAIKLAFKLARTALNES